MNQMVGDDVLDERINEGETTFVEEFEITVGEVRVKDEESGDREWLWKAKTDSGTSYVSGTITDAVMGCIERETDGVI